MTPKPKFNEGEKVLCFHGPLIYEAKALKLSISKEKQIKYYIHYAGWNKNWDEWVPESRVLKYNEINVQKQKELFKDHAKQNAKKQKTTAKGKRGDANVSLSKDGAVSSGGSESRASTPSKDLNISTPINRGNRIKVAAAVPKESEPNAKKDESMKDDAASSEGNKEEPSKKKRGTSAPSIVDKPLVPTTTNDEETYVSKSDIKIKLPDELKQFLADDWDAVTRQHKLVDIPAETTVQDIVDQYIAFKKANKTPVNSKEAPLTDVLNGVVEYFNVMLGSQLLYKFERPQYAEILQQHKDTPLSKLYGGYHLLRLFVKLGNMLGYSGLDDKTLQSLLVHINDFIKFLAKNNTYFSMSNYVNVAPEYHRNTQ